MASFDTLDPSPPGSFACRLPSKSPAEAGSLRAARWRNLRSPATRSATVCRKTLDLLPIDGNFNRENIGEMMGNNQLWEYPIFRQNRLEDGYQNTKFQGHSKKTD